MNSKQFTESTTSGAIATVAVPLGKPDSRIGKGIYPNEKGGNLLTGKKTNKKFANSIKESLLNEIDFASALGELQLPKEEIIKLSTPAGTIGSRNVFIYQNGKDKIYFFTEDSKIEALVYLYDGRLMAMKNYSSNKGLIYNLFQYIINIEKQKIKLLPIDKLTNDGIKWIVDQLNRTNGFTITDLNNNPISATELYDEWKKAHETGNSGPTGIIISESKNSHQIRENETRIMPMDTFGATLSKLDTITENLINIDNLIINNTTTNEINNMKKSVQDNKKFANSTSVKESKTVKDRKTGTEYDPAEEFEKLQNDPDYVAQMKRMGREEGKGWPKRKEQSVSEAKLDEEDIIIVPGQGNRLKPGFIPKAKDRTDHEVQMAKSDLFQAHKNAKKIYQLIKNTTEEEGIEGWVQEKIIKANDYLNTVREYLEHEALHEVTIAGKQDNFTIDDIKALEQIRDLETIKAKARELIKGKPDRRMKPEKIDYFYNKIDTLTSPMQVIKLMYDLLLAGEGMKTIGSRYSTSSNSYQRRFNEMDQDTVEEGKVAGAVGVLALLAALMGGNEITSAKYTPLGKALAVAAQQGDQEAAKHYKNLDTYIDSKQSALVTQLSDKYLGDLSLREGVIGGERPQETKKENDRITAAYRKKHLPNKDNKKDIKKESSIMKGIDPLSKGIQNEQSEDGWGSQSKRDFKRQEMEHELGHETRRTYTNPKGMFFYNVPADKETDARQAGLKQTKSGKWYGYRDNMFGKGKYWAPKNESVTEQTDQEHDTESLQKHFGAEVAYDAASHGPAMMQRKDLKGDLYQLTRLPNKNYKATLVTESTDKCPECGGKLVAESELDEGKKDACYYKVKSRVKIWPSAYASGQLVQCRKRGAKNWGKGSKK